MKTLLLALALLACCSAFAPNEFYNLTTTEINDNPHLQKLIPSGLADVLKINDLNNQFNTTDFIVDKINFVSMKEFDNGYIYKVNVDFLNSADEIAQTLFTGTYNKKMGKLFINSLSYDIKYPKVEPEEEIFVPSPINGTYSTGIYKNLRNYLNENFNKTAVYNQTNSHLVLRNESYVPQKFNNTQQWNNYTNTTWRNNTEMTYSNSTNVTNNEISSANITEFVYNSLNILVDEFNKTMNFDNNSTSYDFSKADLSELEPVVDELLTFVTKGIEETFGMSWKQIMRTLQKFGEENYEDLHDVADALHDVADELGNVFA